MARAPWLLDPAGGGAGAGGASIATTACPSPWACPFCWPPRIIVIGGGWRWLWRLPSRMIWGVDGPLYGENNQPIARGSDPHRPARRKRTATSRVVICIQHIARAYRQRDAADARRAAFPGRSLPAARRQVALQSLSFHRGHEPRRVELLGEMGCAEDDLTALAIRLFWRRPAVNLRHVAAGSSIHLGNRRTGGCQLLHRGFCQGPAAASYRCYERRCRTTAEAVFEWLEPRVPLPRIVGKTFTTNGFSGRRQSTCP